MVCIECKSPLSESRIKRHAKFCTRKCSSINNSKKLKALNPTSGLPTATVGALNEMRASAELLSRGYHVFRAVSPSCPCDLIAMRDGESIRVEVTTGYKNQDGSIGYPPHTSGEYDMLIVVVGDSIFYNP